MPVEAIREEISTAFHLVVQIDRLEDGSRKITAISEVRSKDAVVELVPVFEFKSMGYDEARKILGEFHFTGHRPLFYEKWVARGAYGSKELAEAFLKHRSS